MLELIVLILHGIRGPDEQFAQKCHISDIPVLGFDSAAWQQDEFDEDYYGSLTKAAAASAGQCS